MILRFFGGANEVGRSCFLLQASGKKILFDAGISAGAEGLKKYPEIPLELVREIDAVFLTHAHLDHSGYLPALARHGLNARIYCTKPTRDIMHLLLSDSLKIAKERKDTTFSQHDIDKTMKLVKALEFGEEVHLNKHLKAKFIESGHILGSAMVLVKAEKTLLYTSDFNSRETNLLDKAEIPKEKIDFLVMESTYSGKQDSIPSLQKSSKELMDASIKAFERKGMVLVPVFAVGRGQEVMFALEKYIRSGYLDAVVFLDGMVSRANRIYRHNARYLRKEIVNRILSSSEDPFSSACFRQPRSRNKSDVFKQRNAIVLATSGMLSGGPAMKYLEKIVGSKKNLIALVGYQAEGTLGRMLAEGAKSIELRGKKKTVRAEVKRIRFSAHADYNALVQFVSALKPRKLIVVHGESGKQKHFVEEIRRKMKLDCFVPELGKEIVLE